MKRYELFDSTIEEWDNGEWVKHDDALAEIATEGDRARQRDEALTRVLLMIGEAAGLKTEGCIIPAGQHLADIVRGLRAEAQSAAKELPALRRQLAGAEDLAARLHEENDRLRAEVRQ